MSTVAPDLRPRGPAELYDAAVHLCTRGGTPLPALSLAGGVLPAVAGLVLAYRVLTGKPYLVGAALFALCIMVRGVFQGAAALAGEASLEDAPISAWAALRKALGRAVSLSSAAGLSAIIEWALVPATLFIGLALWSPLFAGPALVARAEAGPWAMGSVCRKRLRCEPTFVLRVLHGLAFAVVFINLASGVFMALMLSRSLLGLDVTFLEQFASPKNPIYVLFLLTLTAVALEPVKAALGLLLLVDARVRSEGLDLRAALERLAARRAAKPVVAALLGSLVLLGVPAAAQAIDPQTEGDLADLLSVTGLDEDADVVEEFEQARRLAGPEAAALRRFTDRMRRAHDAGESTEVLMRRLREGLAEVRSAGEVPSTQMDDPKAAAQSVLAQPEFEAPPERLKPEPEPEPEGESLLARFLKWLLGDRKPPERTFDPSVPWGGLGAGLFQVVTYVLLGLAIAVLAYVLIRALWSRREEEKEEDSEARAAATGGADQQDLESALAKEPRGWWSDADALAARGEHRAAVRALYLAVLSALHRNGAIEYDPTRSNWDYVRAFRGKLEQLPGFRDLTRRFDFVWYGRIGADATSYGAARALAAPLVERGPDA
ncbi:MAG: DUF4129 domain-containing protein [Deltaproteobacteria bacterium]|nr:DUF4129 domain-containing protein [Deltaproteobacteria bacterium]